MAESVVDLGAALAALREQGALHCDPVRFHYLDALARRSAQQREDVRRVLDARLTNALASFQADCEVKRQEAGAASARIADRFPDDTAEEQRHPASLGDLVRQMAQVSARESVAGDDASRIELKAVRDFRNTWSQLSVDKQLNQAIVQAPENAGPLNSHMLVVRSLMRMRDISPDYLNRFMSYTDTLLGLEQAESRRQAAGKKPPKAKAKRPAI